MVIEIYNTPLRPPYGNICSTSPPHHVKVALMQALQIYTCHCMVDFRLVCYKRKQKLLSELLSSTCNKRKIKISPFPSNVVEVSSLILCFCFSRSWSTQRLNASPLNRRHAATLLAPTHTNSGTGLWTLTLAGRGWEEAPNNRYHLLGMWTWKFKQSLVFGLFFLLKVSR